MLNKRVWVAGLATLLVLILATFVVAQPQGTEAMLVVSAGQVVVNQAGGAIFAGVAETAVTAGDIVTVTQGDTIRVDENGTAQLRLQDGSTVDLFGGTTLTVSELVTSDNSYRVRLNLLSGKTLNRVIHLLKAGDAFEVKTPSSTASVRGTEFTVEARSAEETHVAVTEGVVRVTLGDLFVDVAAGFQVTAVVGQELRVVPLDGPITPPVNIPINTQGINEQPTGTPTEDERSARR